MKGDFETIVLYFRIISQVFPFPRKCNCGNKTKKTKKTNQPVPVKCIEDATCDVLGTEDDCPDGICFEG